MDRSERLEAIERIGRWRERSMLAFIALVLSAGVVIAGCAAFTPAPPRVESPPDKLLQPTDVDLVDLTTIEAKMVARIGLLEEKIRQLDSVKETAEDAATLAGLLGGGGVASGLINLFLQRMYEERRKQISGEVVWQGGELEKIRQAILLARSPDAAASKPG